MEELSSFIVCLWSCLVLVLERTKVKLHGAHRLCDKGMSMLVGTGLDQGDVQGRVVFFETSRKHTACQTSTDNEIICHCTDPEDD